jgi:outer membrane autotransporter protein
VTNSAQLIFNRSDALSIDNLIEGSGRVRHSGSGTLTLSRSNTYSGGTTVDGGGTLRVLSGSSLGSGDLTLTRGTIRADAGTLTNRTTLAVGGNYSQASGTELELGVAGIGTNEFDRVRVTGRASLNGTLRLTALGTYRPVHNTQFVVLSATGGVSGQFSGVTNSVTVSPLLDLQVKYNPNDVTLYWGHASFVPYAANDSQRAVAAALDSIVTSTAAEDVALIDRLDYDFISNLRPGLQGAFDAIAPNGLTAMFGTSFAVMDLQGDQFLKRANELLADYPAIYSAALRDQAASAQAFDAYVKNPWSAYVELPFSSVGVDPTATTKGYDVSTRGVRFGLDRRLGDNFFVGLSGGFNSSKADVTGGTEVDASGYGADVYAVWFKQGLHLLGMVGGTVNSMDTTRQSFGGVATGSADGMGLTGLVGGGYDVQKGAWKVGGQATLQYMRAEIDPFTETGSLAPLRVLSQSAESVHTQVGASVRYRRMVGPWTILTPQLYVGWRHELQSDRLALDSQFAGRVGQTFTVFGPKLGTDSIIGSTGLSVQWRPAVNTAVNYTRQVGRSGYTSENFQLTARLSF